METMSNVLLWQYFVIGGPCAVLGGAVVWWVNKQYIEGLEYIVLYPPRYKAPLTAKEIAENLLKELS